MSLSGKLGNCDEEEGPTEVPPPRWFRYNSPGTQLILIALVCFCCPDMFNVLSGIGGGGQEDDQDANDANTACAIYEVCNVRDIGRRDLQPPRPPCNPFRRVLHS